MKKNYNTYNKVIRTIFSIYFILFAVLISVGQNTTKTIDGKVIDKSTGAPITAAKISTLSGVISTISKEEGKFSITVDADVNVLVIEASGFLSKQVSVTNNMEVYLISDAFTSMMVDYTGLIGKQRNDFEDGNFKATIPLSGFENIDDQIRTLSAGNVYGIKRSGINTIGSALFLNGLNSLNARNQPLYIVDGVYWEDLNEAGNLFQGMYINPLSIIDPDNIARVEIIKNGTAIYGSKGANGVIIIDTKSGESQVTKINVSSVVGVAEAPGSMPMMGGDDYRIYASEILGTVDGTVGSYQFLDEDPTLNYYPKYHNNTDWMNEVYRQAISSKSSISVEGGDERAKYLFSLGYRFDEGVVKTTSLDRLNANFKADINFTDNLDMGWNIGYADVNRNLVNYGVDYYSSPVFLSYIKAPFFSPYSFTTIGQRTKDLDDSDELGVGNPSAILQNGRSENSQYRFNIGIRPTYKVTDKLTIANNFDYSFYNLRDRYYRPTIGSAEMIMTDGGISNSSVLNQSSKLITVYEDLQGIYETKTSNNGMLRGLLGYRYYNTNYKSVYAEGHNTPNDSYKSLEDATGYKNIDSYDNQNKSISWYANGQYRIKDRYQINASLSADASSRFGVDTKGISFLGTDWGIFYSLGGEWLVSSEEFMKSVDFINLLKVRASYDKNGNDDIGYYNKYPYIESAFYMTKAVGKVIGNIANSSIQWETTNSLNAGIDLALFNDAISISANAFMNTTNDLLSYKLLPVEAGVEYYYTNGGSMTNKGYDVSANIHLVNRKSLKWELGMSVGHYANQITEMPTGKNILEAFDAEYLIEDGNAGNSFYGYKNLGVYESAQQVADYNNLKIVDESGNDQYFGVGDAIFEDISGANGTPDGIIDAYDKQIIGNPNPDFYGNITTRISINNLELSGVLTYSYGGEVYNYLRKELESGASLANQSAAMLNRWRSEGQNGVALPKATYGDPMGNARFSDRWIEDGSYLKLSSIAIAYNLPIKKGSISGVKVWLSGNNLLTLTNYLGVDPEFSYGNSTYLQGIDVGILPNSRNVSFGIKLSL